MSSRTKIRVCFVCLGNICRSPTAEGVFAHLVERAGLSHLFEIDSAGTGSWHVGELPDARTRAHAKTRGLNLTMRARHFTSDDFDAFDHIVVMDHSNRDNVLRLAPNDAAAAKVSLLRAHDPASPPDAEVPDPYHGGPAGFDEVLDLCFAACAGLLDRVTAAK